MLSAATAQNHASAIGPGQRDAGHTPFLNTGNVLHTQTFHSSHD